MRISGLIALAKGMQGFFALNGVEATVDVGWKARSKILNQGPGGANRVVLIPGRLPPDGAAPKSLEAGAITKPRHNHATKELAWWHRIITVSIWGVAPAGYQGGLGLGDEADQLGATEDLFESTVQAVHRAVLVDPSGVQHQVGLADAVWEGAQWVMPPTELAFGRELLVYLIHNGPLFDLDVTKAIPQPSVGRNPAT